MVSNAISTESASKHFLLKEKVMGYGPSPGIVLSNIVKHF